jgi:hypothetical protein
MAKKSGHRENHSERLHCLIMSKVITQSLGAIAELKVADLLVEGPRAVAELAQESGADEGALYRVLRMLTSYEIFAETQPGYFGLTPVSELLVSDSPGSMREMAVFIAHPVHNAAYSDMLHSIRTGQTAFNKAHGAEIFDYFTSDADFFTVFNNAMTADSRKLEGTISSSYDFSRFNTLVDVGGGLGNLLMEILRACPGLKGCLFDLPEVIDDAREAVTAEGMVDRIQLTGGSFFDAVPVAADAYIMKYIIHDWDDERCVKILQNCKENLAPDGKILVVEHIVPEDDQPGIAKLLDIEMLLLPGGRERSRTEYEALFAAADLRLDDVIPTRAAFSILEAVPI